MANRPELRILCFGASITAGHYCFGLKHHPYAIRLKHRLKESLPSYNIIIDVDGLAGDRVLGGQYLPRLTPHIHAAAGKKYDWLIFQGGGNDLGWGMKSDSIFDELTKLWRLCLDGGAKVMALTVTETANESTQTRERYDELNKLIKGFRDGNFAVADVCQRVPYAAMDPELRKVIWDDGLHFKPSGYDLIEAKPVPDTTSNGIRDKSNITLFDAFEHQNFSEIRSSTLHAVEHIDYVVPGTTILIDILLDTYVPIERAALGRTILRAQLTLRQHLQQHGNSWLPRDSDPYEVDDKRSGKCMIGMQSAKKSRTGEDRLTYQCVYDVFQGLYDSLYFKRKSYTGIYQIQNGTKTVGTGKVMVGNVPYLRMSEERRNWA
ncbi:MAG: hypothetical protein Q9181_007030 [Wetmoreana brouardii]